MADVLGSVAKPITTGMAMGVPSAFASMIPGLIVGNGGKQQPGGAQKPQGTFSTMPQTPGVNIPTRVPAIGESVGTGFEKPTGGLEAIIRTLVSRGIG